MKKIIKLKESDLQRIVKRVLSEQVFPAPQKPKGVSSGNISSTPPGGNISSTPPGGNISSTHNPHTELGAYPPPDGFIAIGYKGDKYGTRFNDSDLIAMGGLVGGVLSLIAGTLIKKGITKIIRKRDLKFISKEIGEILEKELSKEDIKCLKKELSKLGKINKLNDENKNNKVRSSIGSCLANSESGITVDQFYDELEDVVNNWDNSGTYRKGLRKK